LANCYLLIAICCNNCIMKSRVLFIVVLLMPIILHAQTNAQHGYCDVSGGKIYYEAAGQGHALVLIHGGQLDRRMWDEQFQFFSPKYKVIRYDVRGFGNSPAATKPFSSHEDLAALLKCVKVDKAYIVGLSLGGRIAIDFALAHPEMVDALIPVAPGLSGFNFGNDPNELAILKAAQAGDFQKATDLWLQSGYMAPAMKNPQIAPRIRQLALDNAHANLDNFLLDKDVFSSAIERLSEIKVPTLIVVGSADVQAIHEITGLLHARIAHAQEVVIQGAGHMINMERPQEFNSAVLEFLEKQSVVKMEKR